MANTKVADLSALQKMPLKKLYLDGCERITTVAALLEIQQLEEVLLPESATDVEKLRASRTLQRIAYTFDLATRQPVCDAKDFWKEHRDLDWLRALRASGTKIDASQLRDGTWKLAVSDPVFSDVRLLKNARISKLWLNGTMVSDLAPLVSLPLQELRLDATPCTNVAALAQIPSLESLVLPAAPAQVLALKRLPALRSLAFKANDQGKPAMDAAAFWAGYHPGASD